MLLSTRAIAPLRASAPEVAFRAAPAHVGDSDAHTIRHSPGVCPCCLESQDHILKKCTEVAELDTIITAALCFQSFLQ